MSASGNSADNGRSAVAASLDYCIEMFLKNDSNLLVLNANEKALTHKFAESLAKRFPGWDVDCEYDRLYDEAKKLRIQGELARVIPDIIVHHRNTKTNLLVIEAKKDTDQRGARADLGKLRGFKKQLGLQTRNLCKVSHREESRH